MFVTMVQDTGQLLRVRNADMGIYVLMNAIGVLRDCGESACKVCVGGYRNERVRELGGIATTRRWVGRDRGCD
jgi:hypothetical protein